GRIVGHDDGLGWAVDGVDADMTKDLALGERDEDIAGAADLVDARDRLGAVGEGGNRLGAARHENPGDTGDRGGRELHGRHASFRAGGADHARRRNARHSGREHRMEDRRGIYRAGAWDIETNGLEGPHLDTEAVFDIGIKDTPALAFVVAADAAGGELQGLA